MVAARFETTRWTKPGVYVLSFDGEVVYIGESIIPGRRMFEHLEPCDGYTRKPLRFDRAQIYRARFMDSRRAREFFEATLISWVNPRRPWLRKYKHMVGEMRTMRQLAGRCRTIAAKYPGNPRRRYFSGAATW